jgi:hypothetical protein
VRRKMMSDHTRPTSDWEHSHALTAGDEITDTGEDVPITVDEVHDDGSITVRVWIDQRHGQEHYKQTWAEEQVRVGLADGILEREDGLSHELASH